MYTIAIKSQAKTKGGTFNKCIYAAIVLLSNCNSAELCRVYISIYKDYCYIYCLAREDCRIRMVDLQLHENKI